MNEEKKNKDVSTEDKRIKMIEKFENETINRSVKIAEFKSDKTEKFLSASIIGIPNSGKSTLLNYLVHSKISAVSAKQQTTRENIVGILNMDNVQIEFNDTPGIFDPISTKLMKKNEDLIEKSYSTISKCDLVIFLFDSTKDVSHMNHILESFKHYNDPKLRKNKIKISAVLNKIDLFSKEDIYLKLDELSNLNLFQNIFPISAKTGYGIQSLKEFLTFSSYPQKWKYEKGKKTNLSDKQIVNEIIREKFYRRLNKEIPYDLEINLKQWHELKNDNLFIEYEIRGKTKGQYNILISSLKYVHARAKSDVEKSLGKSVNLSFKILR
eukprot:gene4322-7678_t